MTGNELRKRLDELAREIVTDPDRLADFAERWAGGFHDYSFRNFLLAVSQYPGASLLASFNDWKKRGRHVRKGEKAIYVLAPCRFKRVVTTVDPETGEKRDEEAAGLFFKAVPVFDVAQTDGKPLEFTRCQTLTGHGDGRGYFNAMSNACPVPLTVEDRLSQVYGGTDGKRVVLYNGKERPDSELAHTLAHEIAHVLLHHGEAASDGGRPEKTIRELEAEAAAYLVSAAHGFRSEASGLYLGNWRGSPELLKLKAARILSVAETIIRAGQ